MSINQYNYYSVIYLEKIRWKLQAIRRVVKEGHSYSNTPPQRGSKQNQQIHKKYV